MEVWSLWKTRFGDLAHSSTQSAPVGVSLAAHSGTQNPSGLGWASPSWDRGREGAPSWLEFCGWWAGKATWREASHQTSSQAHIHSVPLPPVCGLESVWETEREVV